MRIHEIIVVVACGGCEAVVAEPRTEDPKEGAFGVVAEPRLGQVVDGLTTGASFTFAGVHERPGYSIEIQVFEANVWVPIASGLTSTGPSPTDPTVYEWQVLAAPARLAPSRWPQGGLLHVRAVDADGTVLAGLFHDADECLAGAASWRSRAQQCGGVFSQGIVVVSPGDVAGSPDRPPYLDRLGRNDAEETTRYYETIGAPTTLDEFRARFSFGGPAVATYYNAIDLGIGRATACQPQDDGGVACAVTNYGEFGGDAENALASAIDEIDGFATVAMVYQPPISAQNSVQFMVYGPDGSLVTSAQLDPVGDNQSIPNNCLNCHGSDARYDATEHAVTGGRFLPFDRYGFGFSERDGYTERDQEVGLGLLNDVVRPATSAANRALIAGWYPDGPDRPAQEFIPPGWSKTTFERQVYRHLIVDACGSCHSSRSDALSFATADSFRANATQIVESVCATHDMPNAEVPLQRLWSGPARAYLAELLAIDQCNP